MSIKTERAKMMRYKRPALASLEWESMITELYEIAEGCSDVRWYTDTDDDTLLNAFDGDEDEAYEFRTAFCDLDNKSYELLGAIRENRFAEEHYNDCTVALIGNRYNMIGYDSLEEDYFALSSYDADLGKTEAGKRLMRLTKPEMIATIGQCFGILLAFYDLRHRYDYLKAAMDVLRDKNTSVLKIIKDIDETYNAAEKESQWSKESRRFEQLVNQLPDISWIA